MGRHTFSLALVGLAAIGGCEDNLPKAICIDPSFSEEEKFTIVNLINEVNLTLGTELYGERILTPVWFCQDQRKFSISDLEDDEHRLYQASKFDPAYRELQSLVDFDILGFATAGDVVIFDDLIVDEEIFRITVLHELGHFLELAHINDPQAMMATGPIRSSKIKAYTTLDKQAFCIMHNCRYSP